MSYYRRMVSQVGKPARKISVRYGVLESVKQDGTYFGLIERIRNIDGHEHRAYAIIRSDNPLLPNGTLIRHCKAVPNPNCKKKSVCARDAEAWFGDLELVKRYYKKTVGRSASRIKRRRRGRHGSRS